MLHVLLRLAHSGVEVEFQLRQQVNTLIPELFYTVLLMVRQLITCFAELRSLFGYHCHSWEKMHEKMMSLHAFDI